MNARVNRLLSAKLFIVPEGFEVILARCYAGTLIGSFKNEIKNGVEVLAMFGAALVSS